MRNGKILSWNGRLMAETDLHIAPRGDWFRFTPGFFESIKVSGSAIFFWEDHYERMGKGAAYWSVQLPDRDVLKKEMEALITSHEQRSGKLRIQFGVNIHDSKIDYLALLEEGENGYSLNEDGWKVGIYKEQGSATVCSEGHEYICVL